MRSIKNDNSLMQEEKGVVLILAIIIIAVMSATVPIISFIPNNNFIMSNVYEDGQEAFVATDYCLSELLEKLDNGGITNIFPSAAESIRLDELFTERQPFNPGDVDDNDDSLIVSQDNRIGNQSFSPYCSVFRDRYERETTIQVNTLGTYTKEVPGYSLGSFQFKQYRVNVIGKGSRTRNRDDDNTGRDIHYGFEVAQPTGGSALNKY